MKKRKRRYNGGAHDNDHHTPTTMTTISAQLILNALRSRTGTPAPVSIGAAIYLAGVLDYLIAEILDTAVTHDVDTGTRVDPDHILETLCGDLELAQLFPGIDLSFEWNTLVEEELSSFPQGNRLAEVTGEGCQESNATSRVRCSSQQGLVTSLVRGIGVQAKKVFAIIQGLLL